MRKYETTLEVTKNAAQDVLNGIGYARLGHLILRLKGQAEPELDDAAFDIGRILRSIDAQTVPWTPGYEYSDPNAGNRWWTDESGFYGFGNANEAMAAAVARSIWDDEIDPLYAMTPADCIAAGESHLADNGERLSAIIERHRVREAA